MATLVARWHLEEGIGVDIDDSTDGHPGTLAGVPLPTWVQGAIGPYALNFTGGTGRVAFTTTAGLDFPAGLTFMVWVRLAPGAAPGSNFIGKFDNGTLNGMSLGFGPGVAPTSFALAVLNLGVLQVPQLVTSPGVDDGEWHHLAVVYTGVAWKLYHGGLPIGTTAPTPYPAPNAAEWWLGSLLAPPVPFTGDLDDARIYDGIVADAEILAIASAPPEPPTTSPGPPYAHLKLDEGNGIVVHDSVADHDGQIFGAADWVSSVDFVGRARRILTLPGAAGDYAALSGSEDFPTSGGFTLACRIKTLVYPGSTAVVVGKIDCAAGTGFAMTLTDLGGPQAVLLLAWINGTSFSLFPLGTDGLEGRWHHIVLTFSSLGVARGYVDGIPGTTTSGLGPIPPSATRINIGRTGDIGGGVCAGVFENFNGEIDDVYIYDRELTAQEIRVLAIGNAPRGAIWVPGEDFRKKPIHPGMQLIVSPTPPFTFPAGQASDVFDVLRVEPDVLIVDRAVGFMTPFGPVPAERTVYLPFEEGEGLDTANFSASYGAGGAVGNIGHGRLLGDLYTSGSPGDPPRWVLAAEGPNVSHGRYALRFNGLNHVKVGPDIGHHQSPGLTIAFMVRRPTAATFGMILSTKQSSAGGAGFAFYITPVADFVGPPGMRVIDQADQILELGPIPPGPNWHAVFMTVDALGLVGAVDGNLFSHAGFFIIFDASAPLTIGQGFKGGSIAPLDPFTGDVKDVMVIPLRLGIARINDLQLAQVIPSGTPLYELAGGNLRATAPGPVVGLPLLQSV